jgi:hypothetical protein
MSSIDKKAFGISDSLVNAVNEALKGGQAGRQEIRQVREAVVQLG